MTSSLPIAANGTIFCRSSSLVDALTDHLKEGAPSPCLWRVPCLNNSKRTTAELEENENGFGIIGP